MPNRNVTVWAEFTHRQANEWFTTDALRFAPPPASLPTAARPPSQGIANAVAANVTGFTFNIPGLPDGIYNISINGLPAGVRAPSSVAVSGNTVQLQLSGLENAPAGTHQLSLVLYDSNGSPIISPLVFSLTGTSTGAQPATRSELRLTIGNNAFIDPASNRTMVPIRTVAESMGAQVSWLPATRTVVISQAGTSFSLTIGQELPGGMGVPMIVDGRTFVPVAYVAQMLGLDVRWDAINRAVYIR